MKKIVILLLMLMLSGCTLISEVEEYWIVAKNPLENSRVWVGARFVESEIVKENKLGIYEKVKFGSPYNLYISIHGVERPRLIKMAIFLDGSLFIEEEIKEADLSRGKVSYIIGPKKLYFLEEHYKNVSLVVVFYEEKNNQRIKYKKKLDFIIEKHVCKTNRFMEKFMSV